MMSHMETFEKDEALRYNANPSGFGQANFNTQDLIRMTQLSAGSQMTGLASKGGATQEIADVLSVSNLDDTGLQNLEVEYSKSQPYGLGTTPTMPEQNRNGGWGSEIYGSAPGHTQDARVGGTFNPPSEEKPSRAGQTASDNNDTFRGQAYGHPNKFVTSTNDLYNKSGSNISKERRPGIIPFNESQELASLNKQCRDLPVNFMMNDGCMSNNSHLDMLLLSNQQVLSDQDRGNVMGNQVLGDTRSAEEKVDALAKNRTLIRASATRNAAAALESGATIKEGQQIHQPQIMHKTKHTGDQTALLSQKLSNHRLLDFIQRFALKQKLIGVHQNLSNLQQSMECSQMKQRVDAYSSHVPAHDYSVLNPFELLDEVCQLSKRLLMPEGGNRVDRSEHQTSQLQSRGLSRLSDIDSSFQVSKMNQTTNHAQNQLSVQQ